MFIEHSNQHLSYTSVKVINSIGESTWLSLCYSMRCVDEAPVGTAGSTGGASRPAAVIPLTLISAMRYRNTFYTTGELYIQLACSPYAACVGDDVPGTNIILSYVTGVLYPFLFGKECPSLKSVL